MKEEIGERLQQECDDRNCECVTRGLKGAPREASRIDGVVREAGGVAREAQGAISLVMEQRAEDAMTSFEMNPVYEGTSGSLAWSACLAQSCRGYVVY